MTIFDLFLWLWKVWEKLHVNPQTIYFQKRLWLLTKCFNVKHLWLAFYKQVNKNVTGIKIAIQNQSPKLRKFIIVCLCGNVIGQSFMSATRGLADFYWHQYRFQFHPRTDVGIFSCSGPTPVVFLKNTANLFAKHKI